LNGVARLLSFLLLCVPPSLAQASTPPSDGADAAPPAAKSTDDVKAMLEAAYSKNVLTISSSPYHLLATFKTFAPDGTSAGDGSIERWVVPSGHTKTVIHFGGHTMTDFNDRGKSVYTDDGYVGSIMSYYARAFLDYQNVSWWTKVQRDIQTNMRSIEGTVLDCGGFQGWIEPPGYPAMPPDVYCVSRDSGDLALRQTERFSVRYQDYATFQGQSIARRITASKGRRERCLITIEQLDRVALDDAAMAPPPDASLTSPEPNIWATKTIETTPLKTGKVAVPPALKAAHAQGLVEVFILISRTGSVIDVEPLFSMSPDLEDIAEQTVKTWSYKPILRNSKPIEVITIARLPLQF
jgi:hypothetical protein